MYYSELDACTSLAKDCDPALPSIAAYWVTPRLGGGGGGAEWRQKYGWKNEHPVGQQIDDGDAAISDLCNGPFIGGINLVGKCAGDYFLPSKIVVYLIVDSVLIFKKYNI